MKINKIDGFTLAEILITLGIIGVIATLTIPALMNSTNNKETVTSLKKAYSLLSQAYTMAVKDNGGPSGWFTGDYDYNSMAVLDNLIPYLKTTKKCNTQSQLGCFKAGEKYKSLDGSISGWIPDSDGYSIVLSDETILHGVFDTVGCANSVTSDSANLALSNVCAEIDVDINGFKGPNQVGKDFFEFYLTEYGIVPEGSKSDNADFDSQCKNPTNGFACTAWVIYNENLDYLKSCKTTLSWGGPTSCN